MPRLSVTIIGDGEAVRTRGQLDFPDPLNLKLDPWNIPTNLISSPLVSFTAVRGLGHWLASLKAWNDLQIGAPPEQVFVWGPQGTMAQLFLAAPQPEASNQVSRLTELV